MRGMEGMAAAAAAAAMWGVLRGWVYNGCGCTVVEQGVVARVTMITIDK